MSRRRSREAAHAADQESSGPQGRRKASASAPSSSTVTQVATWANPRSARGSRSRGGSTGSAPGGRILRYSRFSASSRPIDRRGAAPNPRIARRSATSPGRSVHRGSPARGPPSTRPRTGTRSLAASVPTFEAPRAGAPTRERGRSRGTSTRAGSNGCRRSARRRITRALVRKARASHAAGFARSTGKRRPKTAISCTSGRYQPSIGRRRSMTSVSRSGRSRPAACDARRPRPRRETLTERDR